MAKIVVYTRGTANVTRATELVTLIVQETELLSDDLYRCTPTAASAVNRPHTYVTDLAQGTRRVKGCTATHRSNPGAISHIITQ